MGRVLGDMYRSAERPACQASGVCVQIPAAIAARAGGATAGARVDS
jgi:hypothetical protein